jgi:hypothetical protein
MTMLQSLLVGDGLDASDIEMLCILGAAFMPSIVGLLLAFFALWLPDDGYVFPRQFDDRQPEHHRENDGDRDWRRAA